MAALAGRGVAAGMSLAKSSGKALVKAEQAIQKWVTSSPAGLEKASTRLGLQGLKRTPANVLKAVKENKISTLLVLSEMEGLGQELMDQLKDSDPQLAELAEQFGLSDDKMDVSNPIADITKYQEEFAAISEAARIVGGFDRLIALRRVLQYDFEMFETFKVLKGMKF